ncbi:MAG: hypothetical protein GC136_00390 [Alphaproteobacteria bacterium]|nr:hypothetical protein [Alphaproteobacteria bacterium]
MPATDPAREELEAWLRAVLEQPVGEIDMAEGARLLDAYGMPLPDYIGDQELDMTQSHYRLLAAVVLNREIGERFLMSKVIAAMGARDSYIAAVALNFFGYNHAKEIAPFVGNDLESNLLRFIQNEVQGPDDDLNTDLENLRQLVFKLGDKSRPQRQFLPLEIKDGKIQLNENAINDLLKLALEQDKNNRFDKMDEPTRIRLGDGIKKAFRDAAVPQRLTPDFTAAQQLNAQKNDQRILMIMPFRAVAQTMKLHEVMADFQRWTFWVQALLDNGGDVLLKDSTTRNSIMDLFTRDKCVMVNGKAYIPSIIEARRAHENNVTETIYLTADVESVRNALEEEKIPMVDVPAWFEGGNIYVDEEKKVILFGIRYSGEQDTESAYTEAAQKLLEKIEEENGGGWSLLPIPQERPYGANSFYHIDMMLSETLSTGHRLFCAAGTTPEAADAIRKLYTDEKTGKCMLIEIPVEEAIHGPLNCVEVNGAVILSEESPTARERLEALGYKVVTPADYGMNDGVLLKGALHCGTREVPAGPPA